MERNREKIIEWERLEISSIWHEMAFKRWEEYTEELYKVLMTQIMITHLEPDILECEVKWALGSITTNKASGGDGIPAELFQILKDDVVKVLH